MSHISEWKTVNKGKQGKINHINISESKNENDSQCKFRELGNMLAKILNTFSYIKINH